MKTSKTSISAALNTLALLKPTVEVAHAVVAPTHPVTPEQIFPESTIERTTVFLFEEDMKHIDQLISAAKSSGRRKVNQSQAIRSLIRSGSFKLEILDKVLAEDGRRKR